MGHNKHRDEFLQFYSRAEAGNGLTRGLESELVKQTYAGTRLDRELIPALLAGDLRLTVLTAPSSRPNTRTCSSTQRSMSKATAASRTGAAWTPSSTSA
jgi:hypothetical protein